MKRFVLFALISVSALLYGYYLSLEFADEVIGRQAPSVSLIDENGQSVAFDFNKGQVTLVHFWATWCPPCVEELPLLDALNQKLAGDKFQLLAISKDFKQEDLKKFRTKVPFNFPTYFDPDDKVVDFYRTFRLPESFLIDAKGTIVERIVGPQNWMHQHWEEKIRQLMSGR